MGHVLDKDGNVIFEGIEFYSFSDPFGFIFEGMLPPVGTMLVWNDQKWVILNYRSYVPCEGSPIRADFVQLECLVSANNQPYEHQACRLFRDKLKIAKRICPE